MCAKQKEGDREKGRGEEKERQKRQEKERGVGVGVGEWRECQDANLHTTLSTNTFVHVQNMLFNTESNIICALICCVRYLSLLNQTFSQFTVVCVLSRRLHSGSAGQRSSL